MTRGGMAPGRAHNPTFAGSIPAAPANEEWRPVVGYEGLYEVSDRGRVRSLDRTVGTYYGERVMSGRVLISSPFTSGYLRVGLCGVGRMKCRRVHRLVMESFVGEIPDGMQVNHVNGDKADNRLANLEYVTPRENIRHGMATGLIRKGGEDNWSAKLTAESVREIRRRYRRGSGPGYIRLGREFGVNPSTVARIVKGLTWQAA